MPLPPYRYAHAVADAAEPESFGLLLEDDSGVIELETSTDDIAKEEAP